MAIQTTEATLTSLIGSFDAFKKEFVNRCKSHGACQGQFERVLKSENFNDLFIVISENIDWIIEEDIFFDLAALPENLSVKGYLDLEGCTALAALPEKIVKNVGGYINRPDHL